MDEITTNRISIEIGASSEKATKQINSAVSALKNLRREGSQRFQNPLKSLDGGSFDPSKLSAKLHSVDAQIEKTRRAMETLRREQDRLSSFVGPPRQGEDVSGQWRQAAKGVSDYKRLIASLNEQRGQFSSMIPSGDVEKVRGLSKILQAIRGKTKLRIDASEADKAHKKVSSLAKLLNSVKRVAFYRAIRSAIKSVTDGIATGMTNAYNYSKEVGGSVGYVAEAFDRLASASFKSDNQLGAAVATLKAALAPVLLEITRLLTLASEAATQFFAALGGRGTYLKAIDYSKQWAETTSGGAKAAKEWKNQLMGFDEINRLEEPAQGGGGGGAALPDYENMFEPAELDGWAQKVKEIFAWIKDHLDLIKGLALGVGAAIAGWKLLNFANDLFKLGFSMKEIIGLALGIGGSVVYVQGFMDAWKNGPDWDNIALMVGGATVAAIGFGLALGPTAAAITLIVGGVGMLVVGLKDWIETGELSTETFWLMEAGIAALGIGFAILTGSWIPLAVASVSGLALAIYKNWDSILEFLEKTWAKIKQTALKYFGPLFDDIKRICGDIKQILQGLIDFIAGVFTGDWSRAWSGIKSIFTGEIDLIIDAISGVFHWFDGLIQGCKDALSWLGGLFSGLNDLANTNAAHIEADGSVYLQGFASGGYPESGQLFLAREAGPELVGTIGGHSAVANNDQIIAGIREGVFEAVVAAMSGGGGNDKPVHIYLDGREIASTTTKYQRQMARAGG